MKAEYMHEYKYIDIVQLSKPRHSKVDAITPSLVFYIDTLDTV
uniref:Uncharacterized protein n=1 Tax=Arundo donax TaxID=35708 RepID=A0A0A9FRT3_ARUDO